MDRGRPQETTADEVLAALRSGTEPVWTTDDVAELVDVSAPTARKRLTTLADRGDVETKKIGNTTVYYATDTDADSVVRDKLVDEMGSRFVGDLSDPTTVSGYKGTADAGDDIQLVVTGSPGNWEREHALVDSQRDELFEDEKLPGEVQALISGTLYSAATTPIEHREYPEDYDLEGETNARYEEIEGLSKPVLIATGPKNWLLRPCNEALHLTSIEVVDFSPEGDGGEAVIAEEVLRHENGAGNHE